jgi:hypothetical protein
MTLHDWFQYTDRDKSPHNPIIDTMITVDRFWQGDEKGKYDSPTWQKEKWLTHSILVPIEYLKILATKKIDPQELEVSIGWDLKGKFDFGEYLMYEGIQLYPLVSSIKHPITQEITLELNSKFIRYHALQKRNEYQYFHPKDNILVAETRLDNHEIYDPTPNIKIYRDYLQDFLAVAKMGLLISVVADRFANTLTEDELGISNGEEKQIGEFTWLSTNTSPSENSNPQYFHGRSILRRNFIIEPHDRPKFARSPWHYFGEKLIKESEQPKFIINDKGDKKALPQNTYIGNYMGEGIGHFGYLYFRPEVLQKYLQTDGYNVNFHMRNWGFVCLPGDRGSIDVGINSHGLVTAFAPDIADLDIQEQEYWSSYSSLPSGEVCEELFQTRMQCKPPHSPCVTELINNVCSQLNRNFENIISVPLFKDIQLNEQDIHKLNVGAISNKYDEVLELSKTLYMRIIETMEVQPLRTALTTLGGTVNKDFRQIKLLEQILIAKGIDQAKARSFTAPLVGLNELRIGAAHIGNLNIDKGFNLMGISTLPSTPRIGWTLCVDSVIECLNNITNALE